MLSYIPAIIGVISVGSFVYLNSKHNLKNKLFALLNLLIAAWLLSLFFADTATSSTIALWALRLGLFFGQLLFLVFLLFVLEFPFKTTVSRYGRLLVTLPIVIMALLLLTPLGVVSVSIQDFGVQPEKIGLLYSVSDFTGLIYLLAGAALLLRKYRRSKLEEKNQIVFVLAGLSVVVAANVFTGVILTLLRIDSNFVWVGGTSLFIFSLLVAYAIVKHNFFDVRPVVARTVAYLVTVFLLGLLCVAPIVLLVDMVMGYHLSKGGLALVVLLAVVASYVLQYVRIVFDRFTTKLFFRHYYNPQDVLEKLGDILVHNVEVGGLRLKSAQLITNVLRPHFVDFALVGSRDPDTARLVNGMLHLSNATAIIVDDLTDRSSATVNTLKQRKIALAIKMRTKHEELGYLVLGYKQSGELYSIQDIRLLSTAADEIALSLQNALRFEEIERFNETLQQKVEDATRQLKESNLKLKKLNDTKDDFIGMASHQLRTPLTSAKGYISLVLDGDAGRINANQRKLLEQAFASSQRMVYLIADLLNVSRLKTGKFVIERTPTHLPKLVEGELAQLRTSATAHDIELKFDPPKHFPTMMLDETKTRQVVMNFLDNAIYYTPNGGHIEVTLRDLPNSVEFEVVDNGIGVPKDERHNLFTKFYRAKNAQRARPDGTGLGLYMAQKVVMAQGGAIIFDSKEGHGSKFGFSFPKQLPEEQSNGEVAVKTAK